jgi:carboxylate-amine ligase
MPGEPSFTIGVEEEYLLVDRVTRELVSSVPPEVLAGCRELLGEQVSPEFLQCQIEVGTRVCETLPEVREELVRLRRGVSQVAERHGLAVVAASSHPFARRGDQRRTPRERYRVLAEDMQEVARRLVISGMHVHVGIEDPEVRIDLLSQSSYALPHLLALSTSSPFWEGADTGLKSYRIAVWDEMPRSGLPPAFESWSEYERHIGVLVGAGLIEDATKIWWDMRPSDRFPTLEMRICDVCTRLEDALCVTALYRCWLRFLFRLRRGNQRWRTYRAFLLDENRWRAQRYGVDGTLIDFGRGELVPFADLVEEMLELFAEDAAHFGCRKELAHARTILARGTSAHRQLAVYSEALTRGAGHEEALRAVVDSLVAETLADVQSAAPASPVPR